ncbi:MAG: hypothetical protein FWD60_11655 [Candidatus Azobacteroides sp.]|nr:hypothetical protein [Candidatus Azobacteroides sp.]
MDRKTLSFVSYIFTPIGWLISFFSYKGQAKDSLVSYHLRQSFGLFLTILACGIALSILVTIIAMISFKLAFVIGLILDLVYLAFFILMIIGIVNSINEKETPLPFIGKMFEGKFNFIP